MSATQISYLIKVSRPTVNKYLTAIRLRDLEVDESYFGVRRVRGKRGRGVKGKTIVFGLLKRGDEVYTGTVPLYKELSKARLA